MVNGVIVQRLFRKKGTFETVSIYSVLDKTDIKRFVAETWYQARKVLNDVYIFLIFLNGRQ